MDSVRYYVALILLLWAPGPLLYWFSIHPFIHFWRTVGPLRTLAIHYALMVAIGIGIFLIRKPLLSVEYGTNWVLVWSAALLFALSIPLRVKLSRHLKMKILSGLPELAPEEYKSTLLTGGIYSRVRHPRYIQVLLVLAAYALLSNYLAVYVLVLAAVAWVPLLAWVEEKELRERFGAEYDAYCARVPRFVPKFSSRG